MPILRILGAISLVGLSLWISGCLRAETSPPASLPPMKPIITIVPSSGTSIHEQVTIETKMINTVGAPVVAKSLIATGCMVRHTQPELPLLLESAESKEVLVSLQCPQGGATWTLDVEVQAAN